MERTRSRPEPTPAGDDLSFPRLADAEAPRTGGAGETPAPPAAGDTVAEPEAREVWRVASQLQAEAARRLDARSASIAGDHRDGGSGTREPAAFSRAEVEEIAASAGIDPSFVALAWREVEAARHQRPVSPSRQRRAAAYLGTDEERLAVTRTFRAAPDAVLAAMQRVLPAEPYRLTLVDVLGDADDLADTAMVFDVPQVMKQAAELGRYTAFSHAMSISDLTRAVVSLHDLGDGRTEATVSADLRHGKERNLAAAGWSTAGAAVVAAVAVGLVALIWATPAGAAAVGALAAVLAGVLVHAFYPAAYRRGLAKGEAALSEMLGAVDVDLRSGGAFRPPPPPEAPSSDALVISI